MNVLWGVIVLGVDICYGVWFVGAFGDVGWSEVVEVMMTSSVCYGSARE